MVNVCHTLSYVVVLKLGFWISWSLLKRLLAIRAFRISRSRFQVDSRKEKTCRNLQLNTRYYIDKQIIPALARVFSLIGVDVKNWFAPQLSRLMKEFSLHGVIPLFTSGMPSCHDPCW